MNDAPLTSSFLSVDAYVQVSTSAQAFNRYAYCLNNPLRYTDPSGWVMQGALMGNPSQGVVDYTSVFMEPVHGISDFNNAYYKGREFAILRMAYPLERLRICVHPCHPVGLGISIAYFVVDLSTDGFNGWGKIIQACQHINLLNKYDTI